MTRFLHLAQAGVLPEQFPAPPTPEAGFSLAVADVDQGLRAELTNIPDTARAIHFPGDVHEAIVALHAVEELPTHNPRFPEKAVKPTVVKLEQVVRHRIAVSMPATGAAEHPQIAWPAYQVLPATGEAIKTLVEEGEDAEGARRLTLGEIDKVPYVNGIIEENKQAAAALKGEIQYSNEPGLSKPEVGVVAAALAEKIHDNPTDTPTVIEVIDVESKLRKTLHKVVEEYETEQAPSVEIKQDHSPTEASHNPHERQSVWRLRRLAGATAMAGLLSLASLRHR